MFVMFFVIRIAQTFKDSEYTNGKQNWRCSLLWEQCKSEKIYIVQRRELYKSFHFSPISDKNGTQMTRLLLIQMKNKIGDVLYYENNVKRKKNI